MFPHFHSLTALTNICHLKKYICIRIFLILANCLYKNKFNLPLLNCNIKEELVLCGNTLEKRYRNTKKNVSRKLEQLDKRKNNSKLYSTNAISISNDRNDWSIVIDGLCSKLNTWRNRIWLLL